MARIWRDAELTLEPLRGKRIAVIGYGSQGAAQVENLRDSDLDVVVGLRKESPWFAATRALTLEAAIESADVIALLVPESAHAELTEVVNSRAREGASLVFAHGFSIHYGVVRPRSDLDRLLVAPKAIGPRLRESYLAGSGAAALVAAEPGDLEIAKAYAKGLGCGRAAVIASSFKEETETDLFGEQAVLCGGIPYLAMAAFDTLVNAGYEPEVAYFECLFEIKLIADLMHERGLAGMFESISDTAQFGSMVAGPKLIGNDIRRRMEAILKDITSGSFSERWLGEQAAGGKKLAKWRSEIKRNNIDAAQLTIFEEQNDD